MISKKLLIFTLLFMTFQYILLTSEIKPYLNMCSDIQGYKYNWFKSQDNKLKLYNIILLSLGYVIFVFIFSKMLGEKLFKVNLYSFALMVIVCVAWDFGLYTLFEKSTKHLPILLYDIFIVGGLCLVLTQFIFNKYYKILEKNIPILVLLYFGTMFLFFYACYIYNPDLSNINGIYKPFHVLFVVIFILVLILFYSLLKT